MSVYREAIIWSRLYDTGWTPTTVVCRRDGEMVTRQSCKGIRRALRVVRRLEAEDRNAETPRERTKQYRRELERLNARVTKKDAAKEARWVA